MPETTGPSTHDILVRQGYKLIEDEWENDGLGVNKRLSPARRPPSHREKDAEIKSRRCDPY
jgi:hypothetical protein